MRTTKLLSLAAAGALAAGGCGSSGHSTTPAATTTAPQHNVHRAVPRPAPIAVRVTRTAYGPALSDRRGFVLYRFTRDSSVASTCYGACAVRWPPYVVSKPPSAAGPGARSGLLGSVRRTDGRLQVTYAGHPLYYYVGDSRRGQVLCQAALEFGGTWYVVAANGHIIH